MKTKTGRRAGQRGLSKSISSGWRRSSVRRKRQGRQNNEVEAGSKHELARWLSRLHAHLYFFCFRDKKKNTETAVPGRKRKDSKVVQQNCLSDLLER